MILPIKSAQDFVLKTPFELMTSYEQAKHFQALLGNPALEGMLAEQEAILTHRALHGSTTEERETNRVAALALQDFRTTLNLRAHELLDMETF